jgi:hypothetical protein
MRKIQHILNNHFSEMSKFGFIAIRNRFDKYLLQKEIKSNKTFQREVLSNLINKITQMFSAKNTRKRFFYRMKQISRNEISIRMKKYEVLKILSLNQKLCCQRVLNAFQEISRISKF